VWGADGAPPLVAGRRLRGFFRPRRLLDRFLARSAGTGLLRWPLLDPRELERAVPGMRCTEAVRAISAPSALQLGAHMRIAAVAGRRIPALRNFGTYFRYDFGA
jgi:hypothetical protein